MNKAKTGMVNFVWLCSKQSYKRDARETCYITRMQKDLMRKRVCAMWYDLVRVDKTRLLK